MEGRLIIIIATPAEITAVAIIVCVVINSSSIAHPKKTVTTLFASSPFNIYISSGPDTISRLLKVVENKVQERKHKPRYAILVNDMLNDFIHGKLKSDRAAQIIPNLRLILKAARQRRIPIFYCNDEHDVSDPELKIWGPHAMRNTEGSKVIKELEPRRGDHIVPKRSYGSFDNTNLDMLLRNIYDTLVVTGIHNHICVKHTTYEGFIRGYNMIIAEDAVTAFTEENHKSGLEYIKKNYGASMIKTSELIKGF